MADAWCNLTFTPDIDNAQTVVVETMFEHPGTLPSSVVWSLDVTGAWLIFFEVVDTDAASQECWRVMGVAVPDCDRVLYFESMGPERTDSQRMACVVGS